MSNQSFPELPWFLDPAKQNSTEDRELEAAIALISSRLQEKFVGIAPHLFLGRQIIDAAEDIRALAAPAGSSNPNRMIDIQMLAVRLCLIGGAVIQTEASGISAGQMIAAHEEN